MPEIPGPDLPGPDGGRVARRSVLKGAAAAGLVAAAVPYGASSAAADGAPAGDWAAFDQSVRSAFDRLQLVGAAVAVVSRAAVLHTTTLGSRQLSPRRPVTPDTAFVVASVSKPLTATMVAGYVDEGRLSWDQPVVDAWSGFRAPTDELTRTLKVRDLLNMWSGIGRDAAKDLHVSDMSAADVVRGLVNYPVLGPPHQTYLYNNDVYALGGYLPLLAGGVPLADVGPAYHQAMHDRLFGPAWMRSARMVTDPRTAYDDYATGYGFDLRGRVTEIPFASDGGAAPAGAAVASINDLAAFVRLQLRGGLSTTGARVASAANLADCWTPEWHETAAPGAGGDLRGVGYGLGFSRFDYRDGTQLVWHNGTLDGFTAYVGFLPQHDLGVAVVTNMNLYPTGESLQLHVISLLLEQRLGLVPGAAEKAVAAGEAQLAALTALRSDTVAVDVKAVHPFLGFYENGYRLVREQGTLQLLVGPRRWPLAARRDGGYLTSEGGAPGTKVMLTTTADGRRRMEIDGFETVTQVIGLP
ncbi:MAG: serine hydrolase domain-containing protein [Lapillicoccus sp.]